MCVRSINMKFITTKRCWAQICSQSKGTIWFLEIKKKLICIASLTTVNDKLS